MPVEKRVRPLPEDWEKTPGTKLQGVGSCCLEFPENPGEGGLGMWGGVPGP